MWVLQWNQALQKTFMSSWRRMRRASTRSSCRPHPVSRTSRLKRLARTLRRTGAKRGVPMWTFYCQSSVSRSIWRTSGDFLTFVTGMAAVSYDLSRRLSLLNGLNRSRVYGSFEETPKFYGRGLEKKLGINIRMRREPSWPSLHFVKFKQAIIRCCILQIILMTT